MSDHSSQMLGVLAEMRDLLKLIAEPHLAQRDKKPREVLRSIVGSAAGKKAKAVPLMNGTRNQAGIVAECGIHKGDLSVLVKRLKDAGLLTGDPKQPQLAIALPEGFFSDAGDADV
ncbi:MarR family transcriptional regulator [Mesorhizobium koreense]|uniref:MarR family transcriptional regulator n=1 Tax=Mesorhizobium koreense TaxID=3074855 RepID=UPI00287B992B|nr:helix-turn-helix domain-containing protein [Mesorhizobium sp. WR6]